MSAAIGSQPGPRRGLPPSTDDDLYRRARWLWKQSWGYNEKYDVIASRWGALDMWAGLILALVAALSAITLLQNEQPTALIFSITTAVLSAVNASLDPAGRSKACRDASREFKRIERWAGELFGAIQSKTGPRHARHADDGRSARSKLTNEELKKYGDSLVSLENRLDDAYDDAPPINRLRGRQTRVPRTAWGVHHLEKRAEREEETERIFTQINHPTEQPETQA